MVSPLSAPSVEASRVRPPGRRVSPSKVWLATARPAGATFSASGTGRLPRSRPRRSYRRTDGSVSEVTSRVPSRSTARPSESSAAPVCVASGTTPLGLSVRPSRVKREERSETARSEPSRSTARPERFPKKVPSYVVLSRASEYASTDTDDEQAWLRGESAWTGPAAARVVAAARPAVRVATRLLRGMASR